MTVGEKWLWVVENDQDSAAIEAAATAICCGDKYLLQVQRRWCPLGIAPTYTVLIARTGPWTHIVGHRIC